MVWYDVCQRTVDIPVERKDAGQNADLSINLYDAFILVNLIRKTEHRSVIFNISNSVHCFYPNKKT